MSRPRQPLRQPAGNRCRQRGLACLALLGLLVNVLLPTALSVGAAVAGDSIAFCGAAPHEENRGGGGQLPAPAHHCVYCLVAPVAPAPAKPVLIGAVGLVGAAPQTAVPNRTARQPRRFAAAQPRAPPAAA